MKFRFSTIPLFLTLIICVVMGVATFVEKGHGTDYAYEQIYGSLWFSFLWFIIALSALFPLLYKRVRLKSFSLLMLHISLIIILLGAFFTKISALQGSATLLPHQPCHTMYIEKDSSINLPFSITLDTFRIVKYLGTDAPSDYISDFIVTDNTHSDTIVGQISMNKIFHYQGYRIYQSSYDLPTKSSIVSINKDVWGITTTYLGYFLFFLSSIALLVLPRSPFRKLWKQGSGRKAVLILLLLTGTVGSQAQNVLTKDSLSVSKEEAHRFGELFILHQNRVMPISTLAQDFTLKLVGKRSFNRFNAEQFLISMLFFPEKWKNIALFEIKNPVLKKALNATTQPAALIDFYDADDNYKLEKYQLSASQEKKSALEKEVEKLNDKIQLINMLHNGSLLKLYPITHGEKVKWYSPTQRLLLKHEQVHISMIRTSLLDYYNAINSDDEVATRKALEKIKSFQYENGAKVLPSASRLKAERIYYGFDFSTWLFRVNLTVAILLLFITLLFPKYHRRWLSFIGILLLYLGFGVLTFFIGLRTYIGGRLPMSNGFETMLIIAWGAILLALILRKKMPFIVMIGLLTSGFALLVAHLGMMNPAITPLVPVLSSPLLSMHVSVIMLAYTIFTFMTINSIMAIFQIIFTPTKRLSTIQDKVENSQYYNLLSLYPAVLLLGVGIFLGAIWANVSWGRYWAWDPKEVWALICFLVYLLPLHQSNLPLFKRPLFFHSFTILAFSTVLMTYFGVNYFLGGMHSYAGEANVDVVMWIALVVAILMTVLIAIAAFKQRKFQHLD